jgi:hypothetical protein
MLPVYAQKTSRSDRQALTVLSCIFQASSWRDVPLVHLQALQDMYRGATPPSLRILQRPRVRECLSLAVLCGRLQRDLEV